MQTRALGLRVSAELEKIANVRRSIAWSKSCVRRKLHNIQVAGGLRPDGRQRWAIDDIVKWQTEGSRTWALIRWLGFNPETGSRWEDSWVLKAWLTADQRAADPGIQRRTKRAAREERAAEDQQESEARPMPSRKMPRRGDDSENLVMINYRGRGVKRQGDGAMEEGAMGRRRMRVGGLETGAQ